MQQGGGPIFPLYGEGRLHARAAQKSFLCLANDCILGPRLRVVELEAGRICIDGDLDACMVM